MKKQNNMIKSFIKNRIFHAVLLLSLALLFILPSITLAVEYDGIYTCVGAAKHTIQCGPGNTNLCEKILTDPTNATGTYTIGRPICSASNVMDQVNYILTLMFYVFVPIATATIIYAGGKLVTSGGNPAGRAEAKRVLMNVLYGFLFMMGAFAIVKLIVGYLVDDNSYLFFIQ